LGKGQDVRALTRPKLYPRHGLWWCYWRGDRWSTKTADHREAERIVAERYDVRRHPQQEKVLSHAATLLYDALDRRGRSDATKLFVREKLGQFARHWGAERALSTIDWPVVSEYIRVRLEVDGVSRLTVSHELAQLRQAWKLARASGWVSRAWDEVMPERFDRKYVPKTRWLTPAELRRVLAGLKDWQAAWVAWIVATGSDTGDVARAEVGDIDWKRGMVRVRGRKTVFRDRLVPITKLTRPLLKLAAAHGPPFAPWPGIKLSLRRLAIRLDIAHFSPKDLRRTHGQWLRGGGVHPHLIGRVLGHADSVMADRVYGQGDELAIAGLVRDALRRPAKKRRVRIHSYAQRKNRG
jgi:integrase